MTKGIDPLFAPKETKTWGDVIPELKPWKCAGCGAPYPDRVGNCECVTEVIYQWQRQKMVHEIKLQTKTYNTRCIDLADHFLQDKPNLWTDKRTKALALAIQQTVEDFIAREQLNFEPPDPPGWEGGFAENH